MKNKNILQIPFSKPCVGNDELQAINRVLESKWLTTANETLLFETEFSKIISQNSKTPIHTLAVQSASAGLHLCLKALGITQGDVVITTPFTFVSTASSIIHCGATPLFIDCAKNSLHPGVDQLEAIKNKNTHKVFLPVHIAGCIQDKDILKLAQSYNLKIIEDAAHCFPAHNTKTNTYVGTQYDAGVFSFYANKTITTAEGGMITTHNDELAQKINILRTHGINKTVWDRYTNNKAKHEYDIVELGYKYNLPDILSAMGRVQLQKAHDFHQKRIKAAQYYLQRLSNIDYITLPQSPEDVNQNSWHLFIIRLTHPKISRDVFMKKLFECGIGTSVHYKPLHLMTYYKKTFNLHAENFPNASQAYEEVLSLPMYPEITQDELEIVCSSIIKIGQGKI